MKKFFASLIVTSLILTSVPMGAFAILDSEVINHVNINTEYKVDDLIYGYGGWTLVYNAPQNGRVKVYIENCNTEIFKDGYRVGKEAEDTGSCEARWMNLVDSLESGWITVEAGENMFSFYGRYDYHDEDSLKIVFQPSGSYTGEVEDNDSFTKANSIDFGVTYEGNFSGITENGDSAYVNDDDYYTFEIADYSRVVITLNNTDTATKCIMNEPYELYRQDDNGNRKIVRESAEIYNIRQTKDYIRLPAGKYYIKVLCNGWTNRDYTIKLDIENEHEEIYEREFNNYKSEATEIIGKKIYSGNLSSSGDVDWYKVNMENDGTISLDFWIADDIRTGNYSVDLYNSSMKELYSLYNTSEDVYYKSKKYSADAGTYYVRVSQGMNAVDSCYDYKLRVNTIQQLKPVTNLKATMTGYDDYTITWTASKGADGYNIYAQKGNGTFVKKGFTTETNFDVNDLADGYKYTFAVAPCILDGDKYSECSYALNTISRYTLKKVVQNNVKKSSKTKVKISWKDISGESGYEICKMKKTASGYVQEKTYKTSKSYINISAKKGTKYYYKVRAYKKVGDELIYAPWSTLKSYKL